MKIALSCETTVDLPKSILEENKINTIPFTIMLDGEDMPDGDGISEKIFDFVKRTKQLPKTSAINQAQYKEYFEEILKENDAVIHISLSSKISSSCQHALDAEKEIGSDKVRVIDSLSLSTGIAILALYTRKLIDSGEKLDEIVAKVEKRIPALDVSFVIDTLEYLCKGGRCSALAYFGANLFKIKPEIVVDNGSMHPTKKFFGSISTAIKSYCTDVLKRCTNPDLENAFITYSSADEKDVEFLKSKLKEKGFKNIYTTTAGGTIASHCGPKTIGILYLNDGETN